METLIVVLRVLLTVVLTETFDSGLLPKGSGGGGGGKAVTITENMIIRDIIYTNSMCFDSIF